MLCRAQGRRGKQPEVLTLKNGQWSTLYLTPTIKWESSVIARRLGPKNRS